MTPLERLADWITGGGLRARDEEIERVSEIAEHEREVVKGVRLIARQWERDARHFEDHSHKCAEAVNWMRLALTEIAAMETPHANATVRRMAARAREAL